jgi:hypothetical protein
MPDHIIHKQKVLLQTGMSANAFVLQNRVSDLCRNDLKGKLELLFNKIAPNGKILRIDKLALDLGTVNERNLETDFTDKLMEQLEFAILEQRTTTDKVETADQRQFEVSPQQSLYSALGFFLENGYLPWYQVVKKFSDWEAKMLANFTGKEWQQLITRLKQTGNKTDRVIRRLASQFSDEFIQKIIFEINSSLQNNWNGIYIQLFSLINAQGRHLQQSGKKNFFWQHAISTALHIKNEDEFRVEFSKIIIAESKKAEQLSVEKTIENPDMKQESKLSNEDALFTNNSGLVLLHPFLLMYFRELGLVEENKFINVEMQYRAILLLHYLATRETEVAEYDLLMEKVLCDVDFEVPIPNSIELTKQEAEESDNLLKAVMQHWKPLNGTSLEGLQTSFLQREGKLTDTETGWLLRVEQKTIDILLDKLPWGIGTIKLPWMKNILNVEWS